MAAFNSSTGHTHSGSGNNGPLLTSASVSTTFGNGFTTVTGASGDYLLIASDVSDSNKTKKALASDFIFVPSASNALSGSIVQVVNTITGAVSTGTTLIPFDDTVPTSSEGDQYMSLSITPTSASNKLLIEVVAHANSSASGANAIIAALYQDATSAALASSYEMQSTAWTGTNLKFAHYMTAGTTSSTTFKVRIGAEAAGTLTFNGTGGNRKLGGVLASSITITEIKA